MAFKGERTLKARNIVLGVSGGIAVYKAAELSRLFVKDGILVRVVMTKAATQFVVPLTFEALTNSPVYSDMFVSRADSPIQHVVLAKWASLLVIAPATANIIGKIASGIADDLLSTLALAVSCPVVIAPAMNSEMFGNIAVQDNLRTLRQRGFAVMQPDFGELACGTTGEGRMPEPEAIFRFVKKRLTSFRKQDFRGVNMLVTAGPTREPLDPVRYLTNYSTGRMGFAVAQAAVERGSKVTLISGPTAIAPPAGVTLIRVETALEMSQAVMEHFARTDVVVKTAAVADYRPFHKKEQKIKKAENSGEIVLKLLRNPDILAELGARKGNRIIVGFAAETEAVLENAACKLEKKNLDLIVANDLTEKEAGFAVETNKVKIIDRKGGIQELDVAPKADIAHIILDRIHSLLEASNFFAP